VCASHLTPAQPIDGLPGQRLSDGVYLATCILFLVVRSRRITKNLTIRLLTGLCPPLALLACEITNRKVSHGLQRSREVGEQNAKSMQVGTSRSKVHEAQS